ncbi:BON domain-containing protein [Azospirillum agricola]|uniref:BON domain-containing protein n=1 Tax=Azospirillum agricola TaxID=1720247 RepID=UPI000A0F391C|nr:BON domain-containing protein [Azospirillum agricola]SMH48507.1 BON domain-containing protein [Azospirillum lipoferum]
MHRQDWEREGPAANFRGVGPRGYRRSDERIREDIIDRLTDDPRIDATDIDVSVAQGEVTLAGTVEDRAARHRAEDIAEAVSGVTHVQNDLRAGREAWQGSVTGPGAPARAGMIEALESTSMVLGKTPLPADGRD